MSRAFSTARQNLTKWLGYSKDLLPSDWKGAVERYGAGGAVKVRLSRYFWFERPLLNCISESRGD